jgi:hypothetical protein
MADDLTCANIRSVPDWFAKMAAYSEPIVAFPDSSRASSIGPFVFARDRGRMALQEPGAVAE